MLSHQLQCNYIYSSAGLPIGYADPATTSLDEFDRILMPIVAMLWPLAWGFVVVNEIIGFLIELLKITVASSVLRKKANNMPSD